MRKGENPRIGLGLLLGGQLPYTLGASHSCVGVDAWWYRTVTSPGLGTRGMWAALSGCACIEMVGVLLIVALKVRPGTPLRVKGDTIIMSEHQAYTGIVLGKLGCMPILLRAHEEQAPGLTRSRGSEEVPKRLCCDSHPHDSVS